MYVYLMVLTFAQASAFLGWNTLYTNFAVEMAHLTGEQNGIVHSVRELPGLLSIGVILLLYLMREVTLTSFSILVCGIGVIATGFFPSFEGLMLWTFILSTGFHYFEATNQSLTLQYFSVTEAPLIISRLRSITALGSFLMGGVILVLADKLDFRWLFGIVGSIALCAGIWAIFQRPERAGLPKQRKGMVLRARYWLFYVLTCLSGARRQIVNVFVAFLLVQKFGFSLRDMSLLFLGSHFINWVLNPYIGHVINRFGEKRLLFLKYICVTGICVGYVFCQDTWVAAALFVFDQILFCFTISIRTFFQKIADVEDIAPSMAVGVTVNHIAAVGVPLIGGMLWMIDYRIPFWMGTGFGVLSLLAVLCIPAMPKPASSGARS
jgi:Arabinose efflux permease